MCCGGGDAFMTSQVTSPCALCMYWCVQEHDFIRSTKAGTSTPKCVSLLPGVQCGLVFVYVGQAAARWER
jgi:hypothetical protein